MGLEAHVEFLLKTLREEDSTSDGMDRLVDYCASQCPDPVWQRLRQLDTRRDVDGIVSWMEAVLLAEPPPHSINAFDLGLFDRSKDGVGFRCTLYVVGSERFSPSDPSGDWAVAPAYFPETRYAPSPVLASLSEEASRCRGEAQGLVSYLLCLGYAALAVKESSRALRANPKLVDTLSKPIAVGFDEGDLFFLPSDPN
jgi:hypothetical protein